MTHIVTSKKSHERTPRMARDAEFHWAQGAEEYDDKPQAMDRWGVAMVLVAVFGSVAVIVTSLLASAGGV